MMDILIMPLSYIEYRHQELIDCCYNDSPDSICKRISVINKLKEKTSKITNDKNVDIEVSIKKSDWDLFQYK